MKQLQNNKPVQGTAHRWLLGTVLAGAMAAAVAAPYPVEQVFSPQWGLGKAPDRVANEKFIDEMVPKFISTHGSAEQQARIVAISKAAALELRPIQLANERSRMQLRAMLAGPAIDRAAVERFRAEQMQQLEASTRIVMAALVDSAEVLAPEQRAELAKRIR